MNGNQLRELIREYSSIYYSEESTELSEEQIWEEVEEWVNLLLDEGYDLSDYTWEEIFEAYLIEKSAFELAGGNAAVRDAIKFVPKGLRDRVSPENIRRELERRGNNYIQNQRRSKSGEQWGRTKINNILNSIYTPPSNKGDSIVRNLLTTPRKRQPPAGGKEPPSVSDTAPASRPPATSTRPPAAPRPAATPAAASRPSAPVLSKLNGVEGTGVGKDFKARTWKDSERTRYSSETGRQAMAAPMTNRVSTAYNSPQIVKTPPINSTVSFIPPSPPASTPAATPASTQAPKPSSTTGLSMPSTNRSKPIQTAREKVLNQSFDFGKSNYITEDINYLYHSIYEGSKVDQDMDGDNDGADVMIARMIASGMSKEEAIRRTRNKSYNKKGEKKEEFELWVDELLDEGYDLSDYTWDEMYEIFQEEAKKPLRPASERRRTAMTSSQRASAKRRQAAEEKRREALERAAQSVLNQVQGATGRVSEKPMGSEAPKAKEAAPEATRRLRTGLRRDTLGSAADEVLRSIRGGS